MTVLDLLLGRPLASDEARGEQIGSSVGIPVLGLDALSSAAYGPEAALTLLIPLGAAGIAYIVPISMSIIVLLAIVYLSYRLRAIHVDCGEGTTVLHQEWCRFVEEPTRRMEVATPQLVVLPSCYRYILSPIVDYVLGVERTCPKQQVAVLIPELVERHWYHHILHSCFWGLVR
jgi:hypothetical protein